MIRLDRRQRLGERRLPGVDARPLRPRVGENLPGARKRLLGRSMLGARAALGRRRLGCRAPRRHVALASRRAGGFRFHPARAKFVEAGALPQPEAGGGLGAGGAGVAVPAPDRAVARGEPLSRQQRGLQALALGRVVDDADLPQPSRERVRRPNRRRQGGGTFGQRRRIGVGIGRQRPPARRSLLVLRRQQIVAEERGERLLVTGVHGHGVEQRAGIFGRSRRADLGQRLLFRGKPSESGFHRAQLAGGGGFFRRQTNPLGLGAIERPPCRGDRAFTRGEAGLRRRGIGQRLRFGQPGLPLANRLVAARGEASQVTDHLVAIGLQRRPSGTFAGDTFGQSERPHLEIGDGRAGFGERLPGGGQRRPLARAQFDEARALRREPIQRAGGIGGQRPLAGQVRRELLRPSARRVTVARRPPFFRLQQIEIHRQALHGGAGFRLVPAQVGKNRRRFGAARGCRRGGARRRGHRPLGVGQPDSRRLVRRLRAPPLQPQNRRFERADLLRDVAIAGRLTRLLLQLLPLHVERREHVVHPPQVRLGALQAQLRLVPPRMQADDAGCFLQQRAPFGRLGGDHLRHLALRDQSGGARAGGGVGEQQVHVARADLAAIEPVDRALRPLDPPADQQLPLVAPGRGCRARAVVEFDDHLGEVASRPFGAAGEDDVVHLAAAHLPGGGLPHHPAQRFDQVGLAAAVRPDDAGETRFDQQFGLVDERLEAGDAQLGELQQRAVRLA